MEELSRDDWDCLNQEADLNDKVIDYFFSLLQQRGKNDPKSKKVLALPTQFFQRWDLNNEGYEGIKSWVKENPYEKDLIFFPIHVELGKGHWALIVVRPKRKDIVSFDSLGGEHNARMEQVKEFLIKEGSTRKTKAEVQGWTTLNMLGNCPQQRNQHDCGVFVCLFADLLVKNKSLKTVATQSSRELRDLLKRKIKWMGNNVVESRLQKKRPKKGIVKRTSTPLLEKWQNPVEKKTPIVGSNREGLFLRGAEETEALSATNFLEVVLNPLEDQTDDLMEDLDSFIEDETIDPALFPGPPIRTASVSDLVANLDIQSPKEPSDGNAHRKEVTCTVTPGALERVPEIPQDHLLATENLLREEETKPMEVSEIPTVSPPQKNKNQERKLVHVSRGRTIRKRVFIDGKFVRLNKRKLVALIKTPGFDWSSLL